MQRGSLRAQGGLERVPRGSTTGIREGIERGKGSRNILTDIAATVLRQREEPSEVRKAKDMLCGVKLLAKFGEGIECRSALLVSSVGELKFFMKYPAGAIPLEYIMESLILAQNERWRRVLSMQVERQGQQCP